MVERHAIDTNFLARRPVLAHGLPASCHPTFGDHQVVDDENQTAEDGTDAADRIEEAAQAGLGACNEIVMTKGRVEELDGGGLVA